MPVTTGRTGKVLLALVALTSCGLAFAQTDAMTRERFVERVLTQGLAARALEAQAAAEQAETAGFGVWPNPSAEWQREAPAEGRQDFFLLSMTLVPSGRLGLERRSASLAQEAARLRHLHARATLRRDAVLAFSRLLAARDQRLSLERSLEQVRGIARIIERRERAGDAAGMDRMRMEVEAATVADLLRGAQMEERFARAEALALLSAGEVDLGNPQGELAAPLNALATTNDSEPVRADLRALELEIDSHAQAARAAARGWIPEPTVTAGALVEDAAAASSTPGYVVGLQVPLPLFDRRTGEAARARAQRALTERRRALAVHQTQLAGDAAREAARLSRERLERHEVEVLRRARALRESASTAYGAGGVDLLVLVDAERTLRDAELRRTELALAAVQAEVDALLITGALGGDASQSPPK